MKNELLTTGDLAAATGEPVSRISYLITSRGIPFVQRVGSGTRLFDPSTLGKVRKALADLRRRGRRGQ